MATRKTNAGSKPGMTNKTKARTPALSRGEKANARARRTAEFVSKMTPAEREKFIRELTRDLAKTAPSLAAAGSDLLKLFNAVAAEFVRRYYPDEDHASFYASKYPEIGPPTWTVSLPLALPGE